MGLLDGLLSVKLVNCTGVQVGTTSVLSTVLQVTVGGILYVSVGGGTMQQADCTGTGGTGGTGGGTSGPSNNTTSAGGGSSGISTLLNPLDALAMGRSAQSQPITYRTAGTCPTCRQRNRPVTRMGMLMSHRYTPAKTTVCAGTGTLSIEQRPSTENRANQRNKKRRTGTLIGARL